MKKKMTLANVAGFLAAGKEGDAEPYFMAAAAALGSTVVAKGLVGRGILVKKFNAVVIVRNRDEGENLVLDIIPLMTPAERRRVAYMDMPVPKVRPWRNSRNNPDEETP